jgi:uncharacterized membrane protein
MTMGPLEYMVVRFEGNHFTGEILPELRSLRDRDLVRIVDLVFIQKDANGEVTTRDLRELNADEAQQYGAIAGDVSDLLSSEDIEDVAGRLPNNSSVALALLEHVWAIHLRDTIRRAQGEILESGFVPPDEVEALTAELAAQQAAAQH